MKNSALHVILQLMLRKNSRFMLKIWATGWQICEPSIDGHFSLKYQHGVHNLSPLNFRVHKFVTPVVWIVLHSPKFVNPYLQSSQSNFAKICICWNAPKYSEKSADFRMILEKSEIKKRKHTQWQFELLQLSSNPALWLTYHVEELFHNFFGESSTCMKELDQVYRSGKYNHSFFIPKFSIIITAIIFYLKTISGW